MKRTSVTPLSSGGGGLRRGALVSGIVGPPGMSLGSGVAGKNAGPAICLRLRRCAEEADAAAWVAPAPLE